jgi:hypothetical protein
LVLGGPSVTGANVRFPDVEAAWTPLLLSAGAGLLDCQRLEYGLGLLLLYLGKSGVSGIDVDRMRAVLDEEVVCTAGQLRKILAGKVDISPEADAVLSEGLKSRNHLVHRFLIANAGRFTEPAQMAPVIEELRQLRLKVQAAEHLVRPLVDQLSTKLDGVSLKDYQELSLRVFRGVQENPWGRPTKE